MKDREETIAFEMNYCHHYKNGRGAGMICTAGMDLKAIQKVPVGSKGIKWGPCIEGHTLPDPKAHCPHWIRRTREMGEKRADAIQSTMDMFAKAAPVISAWRKNKPLGKSEIITCPICSGRLHLSQAAHNGHVHAKCETKDCIAFTE